MDLVGVFCGRRAELGYPLVDFRVHGRVAAVGLRAEHDNHVGPWKCTPEARSYLLSMGSAWCY